MSEQDDEPQRVVVTDVRLSMDAVLRLTLQVMWIGFLIGLIAGIVWWIVQSFANAGSPY